MSSLFSKPKMQALPEQQAVEEPQVVQEEEEKVKGRKRAKLATQGRQQNLLAGIQNVLKTRLGE